MIITDKEWIIAFLRGQEGDHLERTFNDHLLVDDIEMEHCHDRIQWIFPLNEISKHANTYPALTKEILNEAKQDQIILSNLVKAKDRFEKFLAIGEWDDIDIQRKWCKDRNHNLLRITRVIRCLRLFGLEEEALDFYNKALEIANIMLDSEFTLTKWKQAMFDNVWASLQDQP